MTYVKLLTAFIILAFLFVVPMAHAQSYGIDRLDITFDLGSDNSVRQTNKFYFSSPLNASSLNYNLTDSARNIQVQDDHGSLIYRTMSTSIGYSINITLVEPTNTLTMSYVTDNAVFTSETVDHFYTEFSFEKDIMNLTARVILPEGYVIYQNSYRPDGAEIGSDGQRITLFWNEQNVNSLVVFSMKYTKVQADNNILFGLVVALVGAIVLFYLYYRERSKEHFLVGFREDEKKVIEYLEKRKIALQSDLQKEFHFSRAKATRIVYVLEEKKLVRKQRYGRTNKLFWLK